MKVLTIREPWASLIGEHIKTIETRSWPTNYSGELFIHAGKYPVPKNNERVNRLISYLNDSPFQYGKIFIRCNLIDCVLIDEDYAASVKKSMPLNYDCGDFTLGKYAWILTDITKIDPIDATGHLSIWNYES